MSKNKFLETKIKFNVFMTITARRELYYSLFYENNIWGTRERHVNSQKIDDKWWENFSDPSQYNPFYFFISADVSSLGYVSGISSSFHLFIIFYVLFGHISLILPFFFLYFTPHFTIFLFCLHLPLFKYDEFKFKINKPLSEVSPRSNCI